MSSNIFDISEIYRYNIPRGHPKPIGVVTWDTTSQNSLEIIPTSSPSGYVDIIQKLVFLDKTIQFTNQSQTVGFIDVVYPDITGSEDITHTFNSIENLMMYAEKLFTISGNNAIVLEFKPCLVLKNSLQKKTLTIRKNSNVASISSGSLKITALGWTIKEASF